jgi:hypothetical protein
MRMIKKKMEGNGREYFAEASISKFPGKGMRHVSGLKAWVPRQICAGSISLYILDIMSP